MKASLSISHVLVNSSDTAKIPNLELIIELKRFSTLTKLLRVTAYVIRFVNALKRQELGSSILTGSELMEAKFQWIRSVQAIQFEPELKCLKHNKQYV